MSYDISKRVFYSALGWGSAFALGYLKSADKQKLLENYLLSSLVEGLNVYCSKRIENYTYSKFNILPKSFIGIVLSQSTWLVRSAIYEASALKFVEDNAGYIDNIFFAGVKKLFRDSIEDLCVERFDYKSSLENRLGFNVVETYPYRFLISCFKEAFVTDTKSKPLKILGEVSAICVTQSLKTFMWYTAKPNPLYDLGKVVLAKSAIYIFSDIAVDPALKYGRKRVLNFIGQNEYIKNSKIISGASKLCSNSIKRFLFEEFKRAAFGSEVA